MLVKYLGGLSIGFLLGVFVHAAFFPTQPISCMLLVFLFTSVVFVTFVFKKPVIFIGSFLILGFCFGLFRFSLSINSYESQILDIFVIEKEKISVKAIITSEPIYRDSYVGFYARAKGLISGDMILDLQTGILVRAYVHEKYEYGQEIIITGVVQKPELFTSDTHRDFNYIHYLAKDDVYYIIPYADVDVVSEGKMNIQRSLYAIKAKFLYHIYRFIPEPESGLLAGILFGEKSALDKDLKEKFRIVGLMHIVVLSGYNISLVIQIFTRVLHFLPRGIRSLLSILGILTFAILVGAGPTVIRASIMALFIVLAEVLGGHYNISRALFIAGVLMVVWNPKVLYFDLSFQLSFLATYGLIVLSPKIEEWFKTLPTFLSIRESAVATVCAQIMVLPLILYSIGEFSLISPIVNVLVLFAVPISMFFGFITAILAIFIPILTPVFALVTIYFLKYQLWIVDIFSKFSFSSIIIPPFHVIIMCILYAGIFWWIQSLTSKKEKVLND